MTPKRPHLRARDGAQPGILLLPGVGMVGPGPHPCTVIPLSQHIAPGTRPFPPFRCCLWSDGPRLRPLDGSVLPSSRRKKRYGVQAEWIRSHAVQ